MVNRIENRTFAELKVGDSASLVRTLTYKDIELFAIMSGDVNPAHVDEEFAKSDMFHHIIAHGMWGGALISTVLGTQLPGPGAVYIGQSLKFRRPVAVGDTITVTVKVIEKLEEKHRVSLDCQAVNQKAELVISGTAEVIAPAEKICRERVSLPEVRLLQKGRHFQRLIRMTDGLAPVRTAVVHAVDVFSIRAAIEAAQAGMIVPVFVGPERKILAAAQQAGVDLRGYEIAPTEHSHAAAEYAVALARERKVAALMRGSLSAEELLRFADAAQGLRTARCISHVFAVDVPSFPRPLFIADAAVNIAPSLEEKRDIVQNSIDLAHSLGIATPRVAVLSSQQAISSKLASTLDAAVLCKMAERGQITGGLLDGPLSFDVAVSPQAAEAEAIAAGVAGRADIFIVPNLEAGDMLVEQLEQFAEAQTAGILVGARVPIIWPNRHDDSLSAQTSCALAQLLACRKPGTEVSTRVPGEAVLAA